MFVEKWGVDFKAVLIVMDSSACIDKILVILYYCTQ